LADPGGGLVARARFPSFGGRSASDPPAGPSPAALRERARREGLDAGRQQGRTEALAAARPRLAATLAALEQAAQALDARRAALAAELEAALPRIVLALAERVLHREIAAEAPGAAAVRAVAARVVRADGPVKVRVSPAAASALQERLRADGAPAVVAVTIEGDPALGDADWVLDTGDGLLDGRLATIFEEAARRLAEPDA
jgi:flagellar biosynthesis/type III secretory pathway protein FliH